MPAVSKSQQRLFGMADAIKKGVSKNSSPEAKKLANSLSREKIQEFAKTKRTGLPNKVSKKK